MLGTDKDTDTSERQQGQIREISNCRETKDRQTRQTDIKRERESGGGNKPVTTNCRQKHRDRSGKFRFELALCQTNPRGKFLALLLNSTRMHFCAPVRLSLMH